jgi:PhoPQ-activated pathogenicity-related protein
MKVQTDWAEKVYGRQSEQIQDYTNLGLIGKMEDPRMVQLRQWVDPYSYRRGYVMPKLLLRGTNDRYWTVDALRNYWDELPGPKLIYQTPNAGHDLGGGKDAIQTLAAWFQMIADRQPLPSMDWKFDYKTGGATISVSVDQPARHIRLWTATSTDRDFRDDEWSNRELQIQSGSSHVSADIAAPESGYRAFMAEVELMSSTGQPYKLSTAARVTPDGLR